MTGGLEHCLLLFEEKDRVLGLSPLQASKDSEKTPLSGFVIYENQ